MILATGYVMPDIVCSDVHAVSSSWAIATTPQPQNVWKDGALIWEDSKDYLYARSTSAGRIIIGGEDSEEVVEPDARDALIPAKSALLTTEAGRALACRQSRHRVPMVRDVRHHQRWPAVDRSGAGQQRHLRRLWLRR